MTSVALAQSEIFDRLRVNHAERQRIADAQTQLAIENAALLAEETELLARLQELNEGSMATTVPLAFDDTRRMLRWAGGEVRLGKKPYRFVKVLYFAKEWRLHLTTLEKRVWGKRSTPKSGTVKVMVCRLEKTLRMVKFPYRIVHVNYKGHVLRTQNRITGQIYTARQVEVAGYKLVKRKM